MGKIDKGVKCIIVNCSEVAVRSISIDKVKSAGLKVLETRRGYLCERHYKEYKKKSKEDRRIEKWRWNA